MQTHSQSCLAGPVSRKREWWKQLDIDEAPAAASKPELFRAALVEQIRKEIAAGTYDTEEKWEIALDRLMNRLTSDDE